MVRVACIFATVIATGLAVSPAAAADKLDALARARTLYNQRQFAAAVNAAEEARLVPGRADSADLIAARAYLERFRDSAASDDLTNARERLRRLDPRHLPPRERVELIVGLGETLFFEGSYGAAADIFDSVLAQDELGPDGRERAVDWWATAIDRDARPRSELERQTLYTRIRERMQQELSTHPSSAAAAYWLTAAARGQGDLQAAWDAALAGWVRSPLATDDGEALRADIDRLMLHALVPERAKATAQQPEQLREEWEQFKERWKK
ncbi:MAG TPA: hypothetical protein VG222_14435 [Vicinamibacterales bacterium]|nr:hypothetical protein [Vicinamibacterales bacterium]